MRKKFIKLPVSGPGSNRWHHLHAEEVVRLLEADLKAGLAGAEVKRRLEKYGPNTVQPRRGTPGWRKFLQQFNQPLVYILVLAGGVTAFLGSFADPAQAKRQKPQEKPRAINF